MKIQPHLLSRRAGSLVAAFVTAALGASALAQPVLVINGLADDLSTSGNATTGLFFDAALGEYVIHTWQRGSGYTRVNGSGLSIEPIRASADLSVLATGKNNDADWGNLNCFAGYCAFGDCTPGEPLPAPSPCLIPTIAHSWTSAGGWVNAGSVARLQDPGTGRFYGGTRCDSNINSANDLSGNGRFIVGGAWTSPLFTSSGGPSFGQCGDLVAFIADRASGTVEALPVQPGTTNSRADSINHDGSVITGYDYGEIIDPVFGPGEGRRICVWTNGVQTLIDALSNTAEVYPVNNAGTVIVGSPSPTFSQVNFGIEDLQLVKWTRQADNSWTPQTLGRPADATDEFGNTVALSGLRAVAVSDDGATVVGSARFGDFFDGFSRAIIWRADINEGTPIQLGEYIASIDPQSPIVRDGFILTACRGISADGNVISVSVNDEATTCTPRNLGLFTGNHGLLSLNGTGLECDAPRIAMPPRDNVSEQYTPFGVALNVFASGTWPLTYEWQREDPQNPGQWLPLQEACSGFPYGGEWDYEGVAKSQLRIGQATCGNNRGGRYRVVVSNSCGSVVSEPATVTFQQGTQITEQPRNVETCPLEFASMFAVGISNSADLATQWEIADPASPDTFIPLTDGSFAASDGRILEVFGAQGQFLGITAQGFNGVSSYLLRCQFLSPCGNATSQTATLTVRDQPQITAQPQPVTTCSQGPAQFDVAANGQVSYQWQWESVAIPGLWLSINDGPNTDLEGTPRFVATGATASSLSLEADSQLTGTLAVINAVRCVVTAECSARSDSASLRACPADFDCSGGVDSDDVILFFGQWDMGDPAADFNRDEGVDSDDVIAFFGRWDAGC